MRTSTSPFVHFAYVTAVGIGGAFIARTTTRVAIWSWNQCANQERCVSPTTEANVLFIAELAGGVFFALLAIRELNAAHPLLRQLQAIKEEVRGLQNEVSDLFRRLYQNGNAAIRDYQGPWG